MMKSDLAGFGLKPHVLDGLYRELQTPLYIPSQQLVREPFQGAASESGLEVSKSIALNKMKLHALIISCIKTFN